jgi:hypothetical protein
MMLYRSHFERFFPVILACAIVAVGCDSSQRSAQGATVARSSATSTPPDFEAPSVAQSSSRATEASALLPSSSEGAASAKPARDVRMPTEWLADLTWNGTQRVAHAKVNKGEIVQKLFDDAGVSFPPHDVLYRVFKHEGEFEVWASNQGEPMKLIATWGICAASGKLGPKRAEGDRQVPEGYYKVGYFHPMSSYYLSAQVDYPNASDRVRGGADPGGDILIHGRCASIGCLSMTDERIEEIYLIGWGAFMKGRPTHIHIFPARDFAGLYADAKYADHHAFWREIEPGYRSFEKTHELPSVRIDKDGRYVVTPAD